MRNGKDSCLFGEELVSYIYDELPVAERRWFEGHLLNCSSCTAEFADLSMSRLGVYEWNRDEFVPLETPRFAIPYASPEPAGSWLAAIRGFVFTPVRLSFAGGALALLVVALSALYLADFSPSGVAGIQVQEPIIENVGPARAPDIAKVKDEVIADKDLTEKILDKPRVTVEATIERKPLIVRAKSIRKPTDRQLTARGNPSVKAPRLGTFEEVEDTSLRLADLVADIDSHRK